MRTLGWGIWLIYLGTEYWTLRDVTWRMFFSFCAPKKKNGEQKLNWGNFFLGSRRRAITDSEKCPKHKLKSKFRWWIVVEQVFFFFVVSLSLSLALGIWCGCEIVGKLLSHVRLFSNIADLRETMLFGNHQLKVERLQIKIEFFEGVTTV